MHAKAAPGRIGALAGWRRFTDGLGVPGKDLRRHNKPFSAPFVRPSVVRSFS